jgi:hypothetical protein
MFLVAIDYWKIHGVVRIVLWTHHIKYNNFDWYSEKNKIAWKCEKSSRITCWSQPNEGAEQFKMLYEFFDNQNSIFN